MAPFLLCESFETQSRIVGERVSSYSGLLYLAKFLSINEGGLTVCQLVLEVLLYTKWKIADWVIRSSLKGLRKWFEGNKQVGKCHWRKIFLILQLCKRRHTGHDDYDKMEQCTFPHFDGHFYNNLSHAEASIQNFTVISRTKE